MSVTDDGDERREWIRIEDQLLLEYHPISESPQQASWMPSVTDEAIATAVGKPTADLVARSGEMLGQSVLLPWMMKIDYLMEVLLKSVAHTQPNSVAIAQLTPVNISGGGISFTSARPFDEQETLALKIILPPFTPIHTVAKVIRTIPLSRERGYTIATEFVDLAPDSQEHIIRYIIQTQAERLRARKRQAA